MLKKVLIAIAAAIFALVAGAVIAFFVVDPNVLKPYAERAASAALGRPFAIDGDLEIERGWMLKIRAHDVHLGNAAWSDRKDMATVGTVEASLNLWDLLTAQQITIPEVILDQPVATLERNEKGAANWQFGASPAPDAAAPAKRSALPFIGKLVVHDAKIDYRDAKTNQQVSTNLANLSAVSQGEAGQMRVTADGTVGDLPLNIDGTFGSYRLLTDSTRPFPAKGSLTLGKSKIMLDGKIGDPANLEAVDLAMQLKAEDLTKALALFDLPAPEIPPFDLDGRLTRKNGEVRMEDLTGKVGDSSLKGWLAFGAAGGRSKISGDLTSTRFDLDDIGGLIGLPPSSGPGETASPRQEKVTKTYEDSRYVIPDTQLNTNRWRALDVDVRFKGERVDAGKLPLQAVEFHLVMDDGRLRVDPLKATIAGSPLRASIAVDSTKKPPKATVDVSADKLELERFLGEFGLAKYGHGNISARLSLKGQGKGLRSILGSSDGQMALIMDKGALSALVVEALHLDVAEVLGVLFGSQPDNKAKLFGVRCLVTDFRVKHGIGYAKTFVLDTTDSLINVTGALNLGTEALELDLDTEPKDNSILASPSTIYLRGNFNKPTAAPDLTSTGIRGAAAVAAGVLLTPLAAFLPFIEIGTAKDAPCAALIAKAENKDAVPAPKD